MSEKTFWIMDSAKRKYRGLQARTVRAVMLICGLLGLVLLCIGLSMYSMSLIRQYTDHAGCVSELASQSVRRGVDGVGFSRKVMEIYWNLSDEDRARNGTPEYQDLFAGVKETHEYRLLKNMLASFCQTGNVSDVYLGMFDGANSTLVYIVDPAEEDHFEPGEWEDIEQRETQKFLNGNEEGYIYDISRTKKYGWMCTAGTPIYDESGEILFFVLVDVTIEDIFGGIGHYALQITVGTLLVIALISWALLMYIEKTLVKPLNMIANAAQGYAKDRIAGDKNNNHFAALDIHTGDEVENLSHVMADMEQDLAEYEENLTKITAERERIETELGLAARIQEEALPGVFPAFPERTEFDIYASMDPAKEVGGDFYDFFLIDDDHLYMAIADVSGKGIPAALFMMASKSILANNAMMGKSPARILADTNDAICVNNPEKMFVTIWLGILEISTGKLTASNAGHEYPVLRQADGNFELVKDEHGVMVGARKGMKYTEYELTLEKGSKLFVYTDGVPEATDAQDNLYGMDRMVEALNRNPGDSPAEILFNVRRAVDGFVQDAEQYDDLTMLCIEYKCPGQTDEPAAETAGQTDKPAAAAAEQTDEPAAEMAGQTDELTVEAAEQTDEPAAETAGQTDELTVEAAAQNLQMVQDYIDEKLDAAGCPLDTKMQVDTAAEEIFGNIAYYAYAPDKGDVSVRALVSDDPRAVLITFTDYGKPYNPLEKTDPDVTLPRGERQIGGLGIFMTKKLMDEVTYRCEDGKNILTLKKHF